MDDFDRFYKELSAAVRLDKSRLDDQIMDHPEQFRQVVEKLAYYEADLAALEGRTDQLIRETAAAAKEKTTEVEIKRLLSLDATVAKLRLQVDLLKGLRDAYTERRHSFGRASDLYGNEYWSRPGGGTRPQESAQDRAARRVRLREARD